MPLTQQSLLEALKTFIDPNTGHDLVSARAVKNLQVEGGDVELRCRVGLPGQEPGRPSTQGPDRRRAQRARRRQRQHQHHEQGHCPLRAARRATAAEREEHRRGRLRQGWCRQEHHGREPRARAGCRGRQGRHPGCRHLRPQPADDDGHRWPARERGRQDHGAARELRRAGHVHRLHDRARQPHDLARPDGHPGARATAASRPTGRSSTTSSSTCRRAPATSS